MSVIFVLIATVLGAAGGAMFGAHLGIAGLGGAMNGLVPCLVLGGVLGFLIAREVCRLARDTKTRLRALVAREGRN